MYVAMVNGWVWLSFFAGFATYLITGSAIVHTSIWSALGDGSFVKRTLVSLGIFLLVVAGAIAAFAVLSWDTREFALIAQMSVLLALPLIVAAQVPFWFLRGAFGWQLVRDGEQPVVIALKQLFLITLVFGVAFAMPSIAGKVFASTAAAKFLTVGSTHTEYVLQEDGTYNLENTLVTLENRPELLVKQKQMALSQINSTVFYGAVILATLSFLSIPLIWFAFRLGRRKAVVYSALYGALFYCLAGIGCVPFYGLTFFWFQISPSIIFGIAAIVFLIVVPLSISNSKGFWLSTARVRPAVVEETIEPVVDPLV